MVAHGSGDADLEVVDQHDGCACLPRIRGIPAARLADQEEEQGYYYGLPMKGFGRFATSPTPGRSSRRRLEVLPGGESQVRRCPVGGNGGHGQARCSGPGLPLRALAANDQAKAARRPGGDLLAHSVAESGGFWDLSMAARAGGWIALAPIWSAFTSNPIAPISCRPQIVLWSQELIGSISRYNGSII